MQPIERAVHRAVTAFMNAVFYSLAFVVAVAYVSVWVFLASAWISYRMDSWSPLTATEIDVLEARIDKKLEAQEYWLISHAIWSDLFAQSFYAYGRANRYERRPSEESKKKLVAVLERTYANIESAQKSTMSGVWPTRVEGGIIFQWHRLHVLALLAKYRGDEASRKLLLEDSGDLAALLNKAPKFTEESYPGWAWWVDNVDAYAALVIADEISWKPDHAPLVAEWVSEVKNSRDKTGNVLAEAYGPYTAENQSRSSASSWMVPYFAMMDESFAKEQIVSIDSAFSTTLMGMPAFSEVPVWDEFVNSVTTWPVLFWTSSAWTMLSLAAYNSMGMLEKSKSLERTVRAAFFYDREEGSVFFNFSTLLDSTLYWSLSFRD